MDGLLNGLRVVDFSQYIPGPYATLLLSQMGADVVKVERPGGEAMRRLGPLDSDGVSVFYKNMNANKVIVELDLKTRGDGELFASLLGAADVLIESYRPGVLARLGFGTDELRVRYPRLVVCSISGYGQNGPYRLRAGHDINYLAFAGMLATTGTVDTPTIPSPPVSDYASSIQAVASVLGAVVARSRTGKGAYLDLSMSDTVLAWQAGAMSNVSRVGYPLERGRGVDSGAKADYNVYRTADGRFISLGAEEAHFWENFCNAVERTDWINRQRDPLPQEDLITQLVEMFASKSLAHWRSLLDEVDCCFEPVLEPEELSTHPQVVARQMVSRENWPDPLLQTAFPVWVDGCSPPSPTAPRFCSPADVVQSWKSES